MKIVADENIPLLKYYFADQVDLVLKPGREIISADIKDADILLIRSVTRVNKKLLHNSSLKFVGSTTAGADHIDTELLDQQNIQWSIAAGCNALAVAQYVLSVVAALQQDNILATTKLRAAVIGVGQVGKRVVEYLQKVGFEVIQCDPLRAQNENRFEHTSLEEINNVDLVSVHTPLHANHPYPTYHMIGKNFLENQKPGSVLLNAGRGEVISFAELNHFGEHLHWCFDVWENEPNIDLEVMNKSLIATPHIAGYTVEAKVRGINMIVQAMKDLAILEIKTSLVPIPNNKTFTYQNEDIIKIYDPRITTAHMKNTLLNRMQSFDALRKNFIERHEF